MGFFSRLRTNVKALNKITKGVDKVSDILELYESPFSHGVEALYTAAWITRVSVIDVVEKYELPMTYSLYVTIDRKSTRITIMQAYMMTITRISNRATEWSEDDQKYISEILDKGPAFYEVDKQISLAHKQEFA